MAIESIPVPKDAAAEEFEKRASENSANRTTIEYPEQIAVAEKILTKTKSYLIFPLGFF